MNKYKLTTQKKKNSIINSALKLFNNKGFTEVSIVEIAEKAKVSPASIYNYFGSKDALIYELSKIIMNDIVEQANKILEKDINFESKLKEALNICTEGINKNISKVFTEIAISDKHLYNLLEENINDIKQEIYFRYIEYGKIENSLNNEIPTEIYLMFINSLNYMGTNPEFYKNLENNLKYVEELFLYGIIGTIKQNN